ncbi:MAG: hypothetical protein HY675_11895 [Chloroflexi bacterium]|nr:hypothetical protein [Chloroflexota bacterium]
MSAYRKEIFLIIALAIIIFLHVDWWAWGAVYPILFGVFPYAMWWGVLIQLLILGIFLWWIRWGWPAPPEEYDRPMEVAGKEGSK